MKVHLQNETTGIQRTVKVGFSWVILFFGFIPFLLRGMLLHSLICFITCGFGNIIFAFIGNKITAIHYLERGYKRTGMGWDYADKKCRFVKK